jgi:hypothetical protein
MGDGLVMKQLAHLVDQGCLSAQVVAALSPPGNGVQQQHRNLY